MVMNVAGMLRTRGDGRAQCWPGAMRGLVVRRVVRLACVSRGRTARLGGGELARHWCAAGRRTRRAQCKMPAPVLDAEVDAALAGRIEEHGFRQVERQL